MPERYMEGSGVDDNLQDKLDLPYAKWTHSLESNFFSSSGYLKLHQVGCNM